MTEYCHSEDTQRLRDYGVKQEFRAAGSSEDL